MLHPELTAALAREHRADLRRAAEARRLAAAAVPPAAAEPLGRPRWTAVLLAAVRRVRPVGRFTEG